MTRWQSSARAPSSPIWRSPSCCARRARRPPPSSNASISSRGASSLSARWRRRRRRARRPSASRSSPSRSDRSCSPSSSPSRSSASSDRSAGASRRSRQCSAICPCYGASSATSSAAAHPRCLLVIRLRPRSGSRRPPRHPSPGPLAWVGRPPQPPGHSRRRSSCALALRRSCRARAHPARRR